jgi:peptidyl-tRNA hydrolase, PTH1 family
MRSTGGVIYFEYMIIVAGLGNPGDKFERTRHNAGFMVLDEIVKAWTIESGSLNGKGKARRVEFRPRNRFNAEIAELVLRRDPDQDQDERVILVKPLTFMNKSGEAVKRVVDFYKVENYNESLFVVHDELAFLLGDMYISQNKSAGGHNGVQSVIDHLGTQDFIRFRLGVQAGECDISTGAKAKDYLLSNFSKGDGEIIKPALKHTAEAILYVVESGVESGMNKYNAKLIVD